jgi:nitrite reductase (NO-forming)/hydroxylamine reductase
LAVALGFGCRPGAAPEDTATDAHSETADTSDTEDVSDVSDTSADSDSAPPDSDTSPADPPDLALGESIFRGQCAACHTLGRGDTTRGPDLLARALRPDNWLRHWLEDPAAMLAWNGHAQSIVTEWDGRVMPDPDLDAAQIEAVIAYLGDRRLAGQAVEPLAPVLLDAAAFEATTARYFDRCAGCHGARRAGAIGPDLRPERAVTLGTDLLAATLRHGTPWGMAGFGVAGELSEDEIVQLAAFLQLPVPEPPPLTLEDARASWRLHVPVADRPTAPMHGLDPSAWIGVVERDTGRVALLDGATRAEIGRVDVGRATHILRTSADERHLVAVGRDGQVHLIDLWFDPPQVVAEARGCHDARSVEGSKFPGYENRYLIEGCYWPSQYVVFDGLTLEPLAARSVLGPPVGGGAALEEVRVAAIVASPFEPSWVLALKESGHVAFVDYAQPDFPVTARLDGALLLHDGGWDATQRYFIAASATGQMVVTDVREREVVARIPTGALPHPGRGANWVDPVYGPVNATVHLGEPTLLVYGADPADHPEHAWTEVRRLTLPSAGSLFLKTHPASPWVLVDMAMSEDPALARQVCAYEKATGALDRCFEVGDRGRAVHIEFNADGSQFWVSLWHFDGEIVAYDTQTLQEVGRVGGLRSPTGKFNVYNTAHDVY